MPTDRVAGEVRNLHLLLLSLLIIPLPVCFAIIFSFNGLYGQDAHEYLRFAQGLHSAICCGTYPGEFFWPVMYPLAGAALSFVIPFPFALQLVSMLALALSFFYLSKILILLFRGLQWQAVIYLLLFFVLSPFVIRTSLVAMSEGMATLAIIVAIYYALLYNERKTGKAVSFFALFATLAWFIRYPSFIILFIPGFFTLYLILKNKKYSHLIYSLLIFLACIIPELLIKGFSPGYFLDNDLLSHWSLFNYFQRSFDTADGHLLYSIPNILFSFLQVWHPGYLFIGILLVIFIRKSDFKIQGFPILILSWVLNLLFLAGIPTQNQRLFFLSFPLLLILLFPPFIRFQDWLYRRIHVKFWILATGVLVIQLLLFSRAIYSFLQDNRLQQNIAQELKGLPAKGLYTFAINGALQTYEVPQQLFSLQQQNPEEAQAGDFVLFNSEFEKQLQAHPVWKNWQKLKAKFSVKQIHSFPQGWTLYELQ